VTGNTPFAGDTLVSLLNSLSRGTFEPPRKVQPRVSPALDRVILRALSNTPGERFPTIHHMGRALLEIANERTQMVWGQSFRPQSSERELAIVPRGADPSPATMGLPPVTERLASDSSRPRPRWQVLVLGVCLVLLGALLPAFWMMLRDRSPGPASVGSVRHASAESAATPVEALPQPPKPEPESVVVGLTPQPTVPAGETAPRATVRPYVAPLKARRPPTVPSERRPKREGGRIVSPVSPQPEAPAAPSPASELTREAD
jgi:hypothetical protein